MQDEGELEGPPGAVGRDVDAVEVGRLALPDQPCEDRADALAVHRAVGEDEGLRRAGIAVEERNAGADARQRPPAHVEALGSLTREGQQVG